MRTPNRAAWRWPNVRWLHSRATVKKTPIVLFAPEEQARVVESTSTIRKANTAPHLNIWRVQQRRWKTGNPAPLPRGFWASGGPLRNIILN